MAFGKVYEINFKTREKNVYPVVYMNRDFLVCKQNGTNRPRIFSRDEFAFNGGIYTIDLDVFKKKYNGYANQAWIYVPHGVKEDFSDFYTRTQLEIKLEEAEKLYDRLNNSKNMYESRVENYATGIKNTEKEIRKCDEALVKQAERIAELKKQIEEEKKQREENTNE